MGCKRTASTSLAWGAQCQKCLWLVKSICWERDRGRYVVVAGRAHQSLEPSKQMCFDTRRHATSVSSQTSTPVSLRSHTPTNRRTRAQIRGSLRNYWMIVSPWEAPERSSMKPRPPCPWQRRMIMSLVVRAGARVDCSACPRAAGQSNTIWNNARTTGSLMNARLRTRFQNHICGWNLFFIRGCELLY